MNTLYDNSSLRLAAKEAGFAEVYFVSPPQYGAVPYSEGGILLNSTLEYPWAAVAVLLMWSYTPYPVGQRIPAYYINSNRSYHAAKKLMEQLSESGVKAVRAELPIKPLVVDNGIGIVCRSSLLAIGAYGTRMVFQSLLIGNSDNSKIEIESYSSKLNGCGSCRICQNACPSNAIGDINLAAPHACDRHGHTKIKCMRYYMDDTPYPDWVYDAQTTHMGCEICQQVCPRNRRVGFVEPSPSLLAAFDLDKLIAGDTSAARQLVGRNFTGNDKLPKEAEAFARRGVL